MFTKKHSRLLAVLTIGFVAVTAIAADENPAADTKPSTIPPSTNPTQKVLYPSAGQTEEQQMADQLECYRWSTAQTQWDLYEAYDVLVEKGYAAAQTAEEAQGGVIGGAARGAAAGLIIGAIAGDAGKGAAIGAAAGGLAGGMRSRRARESAESLECSEGAECGPPDFGGVTPATMDGTTWTRFGRCMPAADARP